MLYLLMLFTLVVCYVFFIKFDSLKCNAGTIKSSQKHAISYQKELLRISENSLLQDIFDIDVSDDDE